MEEKLLKTVAHHFDEHGIVTINVDRKYQTITDIYGEPKKQYIKSYFYGEVTITTRDDSLPLFLQKKIGGTVRLKIRRYWEWRLREEELLMKFLQSIRPCLIKRQLEVSILIEFLQYKDTRPWEHATYMRALERVKSKKESWIGINKPSFNGPYLL